MGRKMDSVERGRKKYIYMITGGTAQGLNWTKEAATLHARGKLGDRRKA